VCLETRANRQSMNMTASHDNFHKWAMVAVETTDGRVQETQFVHDLMGQLIAAEFSVVYSLFLLNSRQIKH